MFNKISTKDIKLQGGSERQVSNFARLKNRNTSKTEDYHYVNLELQQQSNNQWSRPFTVATCVPNRTRRTRRLTIRCQETRRTKPLRSSTQTGSERTFTICSAVLTQYRSVPDGQPSIDWLSSVLRPRQHSIGYMWDGSYRSKDPTNSIKVLKEQIDYTDKSSIQ